jgi:uncharacterized membrane protein
MKTNSVRRLTLAAVIGALYAVLTLTASVFGVTYGPIQCRVSEALCVLPFFFPEARWGLFIGCLVANLISPYGLPDLVLGSLATLIAACLTARIPAKAKWLAPLPPVLCNAVIVGALLAWYEAGFGSSFPALYAFNAVTVGAGELVACYIFGGVLLVALPKISYFRARIPADKLPPIGRAAVGNSPEA